VAADDPAQRRDEPARRRPHLLDDPDAAVGRLAAVADNGGNPEEIVTGRCFDTAVYTAFQALGGKYQQVIELVDVNGLSYAEAARVLGIPEGTVMSRLHRARQKIRDHLAATGVAPGEETHEQVAEPADAGGLPQGRPPAAVLPGW
jgi:RNA polymerase sigma factor (sigma-70 family)